MELDLIFDFIIDNNIATAEEVNLITCINGYNKKTLNSIIFVRTGYHDTKQLITCEPDNYLIHKDLLNIIFN